MVLTTLYKFVANALTYVGNHTGPCLIQLNGQAIVIVLTNGEEINQWPYNCIRQFRAEDESGKFSFVSGRRGPYGVAEYNFSMPNNSLINLQGALTEFTGAQFSAIAPGSGTDQQPLQMPQPLPPYPSMLPYQSNTQSFTLPHRMTTGRKDSVLSDVSTDSAFSSPIHSSQLPKLPPRDYIQAVPIKDDERLISRSRTSSSLSSSQSMDIGTRPSLPPPRRDAKELSPETLVAKSTTYEETHVISQQQNQVAEKGKPSIVPSKKKSLLSRIRRSDKSNVESDKKSLNKGENSNSSPYISRPIPQLQTESTSAINLKPDGVNIQTYEQIQGNSPGEEVKRLSNGEIKKESPYDRLPSSKDLAMENSQTLTANENREPLASPDLEIGRHNSQEALDGKKSPLLNDCTDLDYIPRSSPTVKARQITAEHAQHLRKLSEKDMNFHVSHSLHGRRSPPNKLCKKSNTMHAINEQYQVPNAIEVDDSLYNIPRPSSSEDQYSVPKPVTSSPPQDVIAETNYDIPKQANFNGISSHNVDNSLYNNVPSSAIVHENESPLQDTYDTPRAALEGESTYNAPRAALRNGSDSLYSSPRPSNQYSLRRGSMPRKAKGNYESIEINEDTHPMRKLQPARSLGSLNKVHANPLGDSDLALRRHISPPVGVYIDIDLQKALPPAKNAPLPPLPTVGGPDRIVDSVYAEISEEAIMKNRNARDSQLYNSEKNPAHATYSQLPPARPRHPSTSSIQGMHIAKARELEEEGYEFCLPAHQHLLNSPAPPNTRSFSDSPSPPKQSADELLKKYNIKLDRATSRSPRSPRLHSESDVLNDSSASHQSILGTSTPLGTCTPLGDDPLTDEYVIVTGPDHRPKTNLTRLQDGTDRRVVESDYEMMSSAPLNINEQKHYSTPNPSLWWTPNPQPTTQHTSKDFPEDPPPLLMPRDDKHLEENAQAGIDLGNMSPTEHTDTLVHPKFECDQNVSVSSDQSEEGGMNNGENSEGSSRNSTNCVVVKTTMGSPLNWDSTVDMRNNAKSNGNILEQNHNTSNSTSQHLTPPSLRRHNYINFIPKEGEEATKEKTQFLPKNKAPRPLPRSALLRGDGTTTDQ